MIGTGTTSWTTDNVFNQILPFTANYALVQSNGNSEATLFRYSTNWTDTRSIVSYNRIQNNIFELYVSRLDLGLPTTIYVCGCVADIADVQPYEVFPKSNTSTLDEYYG